MSSAWLNIGYIGPRLPRVSPHSSRRSRSEFWPLTWTDFGSVQII
jgi:hypothetical protein